MSKTAQFICWAVFACFLAFAVYKSQAIGPYGTFATNDFIEYWSAYQAFAQGGNGYSPQALQQIQVSLGRSADSPLMMWNPPWLMTFMLPILQQDFVLAAKLWYFASLSLVLLSGWILWLTFSCNRRELGIFLCLSLFFYPVWETLLLGQVSSILVLGLSLLFYGLKKNYAPVCGLAVILLSIKVHVVYLILIALLQRSLRVKDYVLWGYTLIFGSLLVAITEFTIPGSLMSWVETVSKNGVGGDFIQLQSWKVASLVTPIRELFSNGATYPVWPMAVIPGFSALALLFVLLRSAKVFCARKFLPFLITLSCLTSAFCWIFDHSVVLITQIAIAAWALQTQSGVRRYITISSLLVVSLVAAAMRGGLITEHHQYFWFPLPFAIFYYVIFRRDGIVAARV